MQTFETTNYDMFKTNEYQRSLDQKNVSRLVESFKSDGYIKGKPILVDMNMMIYDGHHRLAAAKIAQVPITYLVQNDLTPINLIHLNEQLPWRSPDYLDFWCKMGNENYIRFKEIVTKYKIPPNVLMKLSTTHQKPYCKNFRLGTFVFTEKQKNHFIYTFDKVQEILDLFAKWVSHSELVSWKTNVFISSLFQFLSDNRVDIENFKYKLECEFNSLKKFAKLGDYYQQWYYVYNYKLKNKLDPL